MLGYLTVPEHGHCVKRNQNMVTVSNGCKN